MKKIGILFFLFFLFGSPSSLFAQNPERILEFDAKIEVRGDASLLVTEKITVQSAGDKIKRGITRTIPISYKGEKRKWIHGEFEVQDSMRDGRPEKYHVEKSGNSVTIYFGDKNVFLESGVHTYAFTYTLTRQLGFFEDYDELYWNVTGHDWAFPITKARCEVRLPQGAKALEAMSYEGKIGSTAKTTPDSNAGDFLKFSSKKPYPPGEGMTVAVSWPKGFAKEDTRTSGIFKSFFPGILALGLLLVYYLFAWIRVGRDPEKGVIIPRYAPPDGFSPAMCRVFRQKNFDAKAFSASLVNMAVHGGLTIGKNGKKQTLVFSEKAPVDLSTEEKAAWETLAKVPSPFALTVANNAILRKAMKQIDEPLSKKLDSFFKTNRKWFVPGLLFTFPMVFFLANSVEEVFSAVMMLAWLFGWSLACLRLLKDVRKHFQRKEFISGIFSALFALPFWGGLGVGFFALYLFTSLPAVLILFATFCLHGLFLFLLRAPTPPGQAMATELEGFMLYLSVAEKDRLRILYDEKETPELFEKFLPYAMALDLENEWGNRFSKVLEQASYSPDWYRGADFSTRSPVRFASSLGKAVASATPAPRSSSSSSSGSGTRSGSSGGGRGGGGGGGW